jgi:hypothetical protein
MNIVMAPFGVGINLLMGGICEPRHSFDYIYFDEDAKKWVKNNNIDRKLLIHDYDDLIATEIAKERLYSKEYKENLTLVNKKQSVLDELYSQYRTNYSQYPSVKKHIKDLSSLYKNEALKAEIRIVENHISQKSVPTKRYNSNVSFLNEINNAFPCNSTKQCDSNMKESIKVINKKSKQYTDILQKNMNQVESSFPTVKSDYEKQLKEETATLSVEYSKEIQADDFKTKTVRYKILAPDTIKSKAKKLNVTYEIIDMDYRNVYPSFKNSNKELSIQFDPKSKTITCRNKTSRYLQIKSIDMYYNNHVYRINGSNDRTYSIELSPEAFEKTQISQKIPNATFKNITKKKALATKIKFGFSVKYTLGDSTKNKTLYKQNRMNLYSLIKNR